jgi:hypothetical protein
MITMFSAYRLEPNINKQSLVLCGYFFVPTVTVEYIFDCFSYLGICCQNNQVGVKFPGPFDVSGPSMIFIQMTFDSVLTFT